MAISTAAVIGLKATPVVANALYDGMKALYKITGDVNDWMNSHIEDLKRSEQPSIARTGAVLEAAKIGFGIGYVAPVIIISAGQILLGNPGSALLTVGKAAVLANPIAMTCAALGAVYYGWNALKKEEQEGLLRTLEEHLQLGLELIRSIVRFALEKTKALFSTDNLNALRENLQKVKAKVQAQVEAFWDDINPVHRSVGKATPYARSKDSLIRRLKDLPKEDVRALLTEGLCVPDQDLKGRSKSDLVMLCSKELRAAAGSSARSVFRDEHEFPYKQILIDVADKLTDGITWLSWTKYKLDDQHSEAEIEEEILRLFEARARKWWGALTPKQQSEFTQGLQKVLAGASLDDVKLSDGKKSFLTVQAVESVIQSGVVFGLSQVAVPGLAGTLGFSVVSQVGWLVLLHTVGWMTGLKIAVFGVGGVGGLGGVVGVLGSSVIGLALGLPTLVLILDGPAYRKTVPTLIMLLARRHAKLSQAMIADQ